jgi:diadenosine tetraphosphate (Ap4A) HIT family hydrolase
MTCPFCSWQSNPTLRAVLASDLVVFLQQHPATPNGAGFIIPTRHVETVFDVTPEESAAAQVLLRQVKGVPICM